MSPDRRRDWPAWAAGGVLAAGTVAVYCQTFAVPLLLDDRAAIMDNPTIRHLWPIGAVLCPPAAAGVGGRPLLNVSFALNYAVGGTGVFGYHAVNLAIHVLAAWTLFALVRGTLQRPGFGSRFKSAATPLAWAIAAIWSWHPLQTEAVTYVSERAESLLGLFYLLTLYCALRGATATSSVKRGIWHALSILSCLAGVGTKEVIVTAPLTVLLYDRAYLTGSIVQAWRQNWRLYAGLAATWLPLNLLMTGSHLRGVGFGLGPSWWEYGLIESRVVVKYLRLAFWPDPLIFDYGQFVVPRWAEIWPYLLGLASLVTLTLVAMWRWPKASFPAGWFFLILAPASSVVPLAGQPMAESRMYLPLAGVVALAVTGAFSLAGRKSWPVIAFAAAALSLAAVRRNQTYSSELSIWSDTVTKLPTNARAHDLLGHVWSNLPGRLDDAIAQYEEALRLVPSYVDAHNDLGNAWVKVPGRWDDAIAQYEEVVELKPGFAEGHANLGSALQKVPGRLSEAIVELEKALRLEPDRPETHNNLGIALAKLPGRLNDAVAEYKTAIRLDPGCAPAHNNLGIAWAKVPGRLRDAVAEFEIASRLNPSDARARRNLAAARRNLELIRPHL